MKPIHYLVILLINSSAAYNRHDIQVSIDTLQAAGIVGIDGLCHRTEDLLPVPKCTHLSDVVPGQSRLRGIQLSRTELDNGRGLLSEESEENSTQFYVVNICGTVIRCVCSFDCLSIALRSRSLN